jgi:hypothetical protein
VIQNYASDNSVQDYVYAQGSTYGPAVSTTGALTNTNPWLNFNY